MAKNTIYNTDNYVWDLTCANLKWKNKNVWWINNCIIVLCVPRLMSSVHEMIAWGKKLFLCLVVLVFRALWRRPDGSSLKRKCAGWAGSRVILSVLLLSLDEYRSWRLGRVVPMIRSAVRTTLCSLLWSDLVAELNQTVIDVQRTDSMMAD